MKNAELPVRAEVISLIDKLLQGPYAGRGGKRGLCDSLGCTFGQLRTWRDPEGGWPSADNISRLRELAREKDLI